MKALRNVISVMMFSVLFQACDQDEIYPDISPGLNQRYFEASVSLHTSGGYPSNPVMSISSLNLRLSGEGKSNILSDFILESSHVQFYDNDVSSYTIKEGEFLMAAASGETLFGEYDGFGSIENDQLSIYENYRIQGGSGRFQNATGNLSVQSNQLPDCNTRYAIISGTINLAALE